MVQTFLLQNHAFGTVLLVRVYEKSGAHAVGVVRIVVVRIAIVVHIAEVMRAGVHKFKACPISYYRTF